MAQEFISATRLKIIFDAGLDEDGEQIEKSKTYSNVKATATPDGLHAVAGALNSLTSYNMIRVERHNTYDVTAG